MQFHFKNFRKRFSAFKFSPKLWDKPARTALGPFLRLWSTQTFSALGSSMTSFALVIWAYEQSGSALSTGGVLVLLSTDALCVWCVGAVLGWLPIPLMNANLDVLFRTHIPVKMQGCVYAARNSLQFFTIPLGYLLGGALVDTVFEPFMAAQTPESLFCCLFGTGKGSGAAFLFLVPASSASPFASASAAASLSAGWKRTTKIKKLNQTTNTEYFKYDS